MLFATPDFGVSFAIMLFVLAIYVIVFTLVLVGAVWGMRLRRSGWPKTRRRGTLLVLASGLILLSCWLGPSLVVRLAYGYYPIGRYPDNEIKEGMSVDEVKGVLGSPHWRNKQDNEECWYYWIDSFGIHWFGVSFGPDGRVRHTYGN